MLENVDVQHLVATLASGCQLWNQVLALSALLFKRCYTDIAVGVNSLVCSVCKILHQTTFSQIASR